jgi:hypothetical protein
MKESPAVQSVAHEPSLATTVSFDRLGTVAVVDLEAACEMYGREDLPYPLGRTRPVGSVWLATRDVPSIDDRLNGGDLVSIRAWVEAIVRADVCVECRVTFSDQDRPDLRMHGVRAGDLGFVAVQGTDRDAVDIVAIYAVLPGLLGALIADSVGLVGAGTHARIKVASCADRLSTTTNLAEEPDDLDFLVADAVWGEQSVHTVDERHVLATGTVQVRCDPARFRVDPVRRVLRWVQVLDDGDYLSASDQAEYLESLDAEMLRACIDGLIAEELAR